MTARPIPPDEAQRRAAVHARGVNVVADAGAGTGKTTLLVARLVELVAPDDDALPALPLERVAAITFTRKAAGELKLRIREALLGALARRDVSDRRRERLRAAFAALDTAHVGTIHAFADRLLRLHPVEARLGPDDAIAEETDALQAEAFAVLLQAAEAETLPGELAGRVEPALAAEAQATIVDALRIGLRPASRAHAHGEYAGLDRLFARFVETRDVPPASPPPEPPDPGRLRQLVAELAALLDGSAGDGAGTRYLARSLERLRALTHEPDPVAVLRGLLRIRAAEPPKMRKRDELADDDAGWRAWKAFDGDDGKNPVRATPLRDDLLSPYARWMARRLVRTAPAVVAAYEQVKARHRAIDQVDLLLVLRNLLRDRPDVRASYQALFDHVLVDEFQDTDPLQAEIVLYLCQDGAAPQPWRELALVPGKLTVVGDPKQSIYRFRRADIAVYAAVRAIVERGPHLIAKLTANFRSEPALLAWLNDRFDDVLGGAAPGAPVFDPAAGTVRNEPLLPGRDGDAAPRVVVLPLSAEGGKKEPLRRAEASALAAFLRATVEGRRTILDPATGERRPVGFGDIAILATSTARLPLLFPELDRLGIPYAARGGTLFLEDALHRQFLLGLRALSDRDDGVAQAALLRAPFFALDLDDLARARAAPPDSDHPGVLRARAAQTLVAGLRRERLARSPGAIARDLLERTAFGRAVALGPNGAQRLDALRELCLALDALAADRGLDFDGATALARGWVDDPISLDPPRPVGEDAVQLLTVHQAKGLEFPVVALWDGCADLSARDSRGVFTVGEGGAAWALSLDGLAWEEPVGAALAGREQRYLDAERLRLVYVAATRARDLLVLPIAGAPDPRRITGRLVHGAPEAGMERLDPYVLGAEPAWARALPPPAPRPRIDAGALAARIEPEWRAAAEAAARPRFAPTSVTAEAHRPEAERPDETFARPRRESRFGPDFGEAVHRAIGLALRDAALSPADAVARTARDAGLAGLRAEAALDVRRALAALGRAGLRRAPSVDLRLEYAVAVADAARGSLVLGYVDLLAAQPDGLVVIDFKTDAPPPGDVAATHGAYVAQVRAYAGVLEALGLAAPGTVRAGLLFTAEDAIRWVARR